MSTLPSDPTRTHLRNGSVGPAVGAVAVIMVLGAIAVVIGRICSGRKIMGHRQYDFDDWVETKCSSCIDGRLSPPSPLPLPAMVENAGEVAATSGQGELPDDGEVSVHLRHD